MKDACKTGVEESKPGSFHDSSYTAQAATYDPMLTDAEQQKLAETWLREDSADAWLHNRMFRCLDPLLCRHSRRDSRLGFGTPRPHSPGDGYDPGDGAPGDGGDAGQ